MPDPDYRCFGNGSNTFDCYKLSFNQSDLIFLCSMSALFVILVLVLIVLRRD